MSHRALHVKCMSEHEFMTSLVATIGSRAWYWAIGGGSLLCLVSGERLADWALGSFPCPRADCEQNNCEHFRNSDSVMADPSSTANDSSDIHAHNESTIDVLHGTPKRAAGASSASTPSKHAKREARDRLIPNRSSMNFDNSLFELQRMRWRSDPFPFAIEYGPLLPLLRGARLSLSQAAVQVVAALKMPPSTPAPPRKSTKSRSRRRSCKPSLLQIRYCPSRHGRRLR